MTGLHFESGGVLADKPDVDQVAADLTAYRDWLRGKPVSELWVLEDLAKEDEPGGKWKRALASAMEGDTALASELLRAIVEEYRRGPLWAESVRALTALHLRERRAVDARRLVRRAEAIAPGAIMAPVAQRIIQEVGLWAVTAALVAGVFVLRGAGLGFAASAVILALLSLLSAFRVRGHLRCRQSVMRILAWAKDDQGAEGRR